MSHLSLKEKIQELATRAREATCEPHPHWLLPHIIEVLDVMFVRVRSPKELLGAARALGRIVMDDYAFSESPLGTELLELADDIVRKYAWRFPRFR
ncbi:MAG: hypothetical protein KatS3mg007_1914 [Thermoanaerobaculum sp.]|nr:MAG: hypothetical protein KatS3mg007_1914 [Thermoanaerobaculum sp.]